MKKKDIKIFCEKNGDKIFVGIDDDEVRKFSELTDEEKKEWVNIFHETQIIPVVRRKIEFPTNPFDILSAIKDIFAVHTFKKVEKRKSNGDAKDFELAEIPGIEEDKK